MKLLKEFWNWFITPKEDACCTEPHEATPVEVEEVGDRCGEVFRAVCMDAGVRARDLDKGNIVALFEDWYTGPCTRKAIRASISDFRSVHPVANAKLVQGNF
jgi:hypothetical protein